MALKTLHTHHPRRFDENRFVYPVLSRRSRGISIGVNLNPDKVCNFDCIYCSVDRSGGVGGDVGGGRDVDLAILEKELDGMIRVVLNGEIYKSDPFDKIPATLRRLND